MYSSISCQTRLYTVGRAFELTEAVELMLRFDSELIELTLFIELGGVCSELEGAVKKETKLEEI